MHFKHSNKEITRTYESGKKRTYKVCDICGAEQQNDYGFETSYAKYGICESCRCGLCEECANQLIPILQEAFKKIKEKTRCQSNRK